MNHALVHMDSSLGDYLSIASIHGSVHHNRCHGACGPSVRTVCTQWLSMEEKNKGRRADLDFGGTNLYVITTDDDTNQIETEAEERWSKKGEYMSLQNA